ncbi:hypothetical protein HHK36_020097 [Tetracentron sinense]|uniref:Aminoacyl-tRNA synthetase class Ia domain-containing protein n=1 Tax=Tetracentron sinense TaxID=13715 RepID=A0A834YT08_TETSI|nr:hypothetical protein HHK36_020097 [Tetracentron sinense]
MLNSKPHNSNSFTSRRRFPPLATVITTAISHYHRSSLSSTAIAGQCMEKVCEGKDFSSSKQEEKILILWDEIKAFENQLKWTENIPEYVVYDGPPFATELPHYGHILAGTIEDIVTSYLAMIGHYVTRRF